MKWGKVGMLMQQMFRLWKDRMKVEEEIIYALGAVLELKLGSSKGRLRWSWEYMLEGGGDTEDFQRFTISCAPVQFNSNEIDFSQKNIQGRDFEGRS